MSHRVGSDPYLGPGIDDVEGLVAGAGVGLVGLGEEELVVLAAPAEAGQGLAAAADGRVRRGVLPHARRYSRLSWTLIRENNENNNANDRIIEKIIAK